MSVQSTGAHARGSGPHKHVFISYAHDSREHEELVYRLYELLREKGVDARIDRIAAEERLDWTVWMEREVATADHVLAIASPEYKRAADEAVDPNDRKGARWELGQIREAYYRDQSNLARWMPVVLPGGSASNVPNFFRPATTTTYFVDDFTVAGLGNLYWHITGQARVAPPLGAVELRPPFVSTDSPDSSLLPEVVQTQGALENTGTTGSLAPTPTGDGRVMLVHVSDPMIDHSSPLTAARGRAARADLLRDVSLMRDAAGDAAAVLVTGNIAANASKAEYGEAKLWLDSLADAAGSDRSQVLVVPGRYDVSVGSLTYSSKVARQALQSCEASVLTSVLDQLGNDPSRPLIAGLENYNKFAVLYRSEVNANGVPWQATLPLPNGSLAVRGITTSFNAVDDGEMSAHGVMGETQAILPLDDASTFYIVMANSEPERCRDTEQIRAAFKRRAAVVLTSARADGAQFALVDGVLEVASTLAEHSEVAHSPASYNWLGIDSNQQGDGLSVSLYCRIFRPELSSFSALSENELEIKFSLSPANAIAARSALTRDEAQRVEGRRTELIGETGSHLEVNAVEEEERPPLVDADGRVDPARRLTRRLLNLDDNQQESALLASGLIEEDERVLEHMSMLLRGLDRLMSDDAQDRLSAELDRIERSRGEGS